MFWSGAQSHQTAKTAQAVKKSRVYDPAQGIAGYSYELIKSSLGHTTNKALVSIPILRADKVLTP